MSNIATLIEKSVTTSFVNIIDNRPNFILFYSMRGLSLYQYSTKEHQLLH